MYLQILCMRQRNISDLDFIINTRKLLPPVSLPGSSWPFCSNRTSMLLPTPLSSAPQQSTRNLAHGRGECGQLSDLPRKYETEETVWKAWREHTTDTASLPPKQRVPRKVWAAEHTTVLDSPQNQVFQWLPWALRPFLKTNQDGQERFIPPPGIIANFVSTRPILAEEAEKEGRKLIST